MFFHLTWDIKSSCLPPSKIYFSILSPNERFFFCVERRKKKVSACLMMKNYEVKKKILNCCQLWQTLQDVIFHPQTPFDVAISSHKYLLVEAKKKLEDSKRKIFN